MLTFPSLLLSLVVIFHEAHGVQADSLCANSETSQPLSFQLLRDERKEYIWYLLEGIVLEIQCCVVSTKPSVSWLFNGKPITEYGELFELSEKEQVIQSAGDALIDNKVLEGVYNCTAVEGNDTISAAYIVRWIPTRNETCTQGKTTNILAGHPPRSLHQVASSSFLTLECTAEMTCHSGDGTNELYWKKYYMKDSSTKTQHRNDDDDDSGETHYLLLGPHSSDSATGDYVNVTSKRIAYDRWLVTAILYIANVTDDDLHDISNPDGYYLVSCHDDDAPCVTNRTKNYYQCVDPGPLTINPLQDALDRSRIVTLFSDTPLLKSPPQMMTPSEDNSGEQERSGVIIGSTIGAAFILVSVFALLFVAYEWHLKLYIRRVLLQLRRTQGTKTAHYQYNCYVACCMKDEKFVYEVLRHQMEEQHGYRLCLPERDFPIGTEIPDEIERCIRNSEYFLAVISPGFWETAWCSLSVDLALRTNSKVVAVIAKELGKDQPEQGNRLMTALKSPGCTSIKSSLLTQESSWDKLVLRLRYAMPQLDAV